MSLHEPVPVVPQAEAGALHFIAMGGAGMSGIAQLYFDLDHAVSGCDRAETPALRALAEHGLSTCVGHDPAHLDGIDTVVVSSAIREDNPELVEARSRGLRVWHRSTALAGLMVGTTAVSIAGAHGKSTTSAMTAVMLGTAGADPSYVIGAPLAASGASAHLGTGGVFVVEADESDGTFWQYPTTIAVITNVEPDHLDNWGDAETYHEGFVRFATGDTVRHVVVNIDDPGARRLHEELVAAGCAVTSYGESADAQVRITDVSFNGTCSRAVLVTEQGPHELRLQVPGRYNLANAAAAFTVGRLLDLDARALLAGAAEFTGTLRRFQLVEQIPLTPGTAPVRIFDDYAHHPTELRAALTAAQRVKGQGRLIACFQPHLYSRTRDFADQFGQALGLADHAVVTDVYAAREDPVPGVTGELIVEAAREHGAIVDWVADKNRLADHLAQLVRPGDLVMTLGAGDVTLVGPVLAGLLRGTAR